MKIKDAKYITSAVNDKGWIDDEVDEICFLGKSNVGKSSFINMLTNRHHLAKISQTPGKTRMLNFFSINNDMLRIVDAPGYGYAKVSDKEKLQFAEMMDKYLKDRKNLKFVCLLVDLRHAPTKNDVEMYEYLKHYNKKVVIVGTKLDKLKKNDIQKNIKIIKNTISFDEKDYFLAVSSKSFDDQLKCWDLFLKILSNDI